MIAAVDPVWGIIIGAGIAAVPATIAAVRSTQTKRNTATSNGHTNGEVVELILSELRNLRTMLEHHVKTPGAHREPEDWEVRP